MSRIPRFPVIVDKKERVGLPAARERPRAVAGVADIGEDAGFQLIKRQVVLVVVVRGRPPHHGRLERIVRGRAVEDSLYPHGPRKEFTLILSGEPDVRGAGGVNEWVKGGLPGGLTGGWA
jgi:hypothetical protein